MNVKEIREALSHMPDNTEVLLQVRDAHSGRILTARVESYDLKGDTKKVECNIYGMTEGKQ